MAERQSSYDIFLSYNRRDQRVVEPLAQALRERGLRVFKDDWYLQPGQFWPDALEKALDECAAVAVVIGRNGLGVWQKREVALSLDRQGRESSPGGHVVPVIPLLLEPGAERQAGLGLLMQNTWIEAWEPRAVDLVAGAARGKIPAELHGESHTDPRTIICPYRGLSVFREEDAAFYFGRGPDVKRLAEAVINHRLVAIVGPSGSGKSSLARAGLVPRLRRQTHDHVWQFAEMVPGRDPFLALARALLPLREPERVLAWSENEIDAECEALGQRLERLGAEHLMLVIVQILEKEPGTSHLLLLVDQWEELYTHRPAEEEAATRHGERVRTFVDTLLKASPSGALRTVITLRADYWGEILNEERLASRLPDVAIVHLRALDRDALEMVIRCPAGITGLTVPDALVEVLLNDAVGQAGDLPLLEFALEHLWAKRIVETNSLTLDAYRSIGGISNAIVRRAEAVYANLCRAQRNAVPGVFAALVQVGQQRADLRRRARLGELSAAGQAVARRLADERLLVTSRDWTSGDDLVEVAHEALLRHWPKLRDWIEDRRNALLTVRQLQVDTQTWLEKQRSPDYLWSHERAREAASALRRLGSEVVLGDEECAFLGPIDADAMLSEIERPETTHARRAFIGERLATIGDPRKGTGLRDADGLPDIEWCLVEGGEVTIQIRSNPDDPNSEVIDTLTRYVASFRIGRYPVTVVQFQAFLADCYVEGKWRLPPEFSFLPDDHQPPTHQARYGNYPADSINWYDAAAFCHWLGARLDNEVRLPTEFEWQLAAAGGELSSTYPWGSDWNPLREPWRANTVESELNRATAVGLYPLGASKAGIQDMAGTVWEWCGNCFDDPDISGLCCSREAFRVLRGGSWSRDQARARCAYRNWYFPFGRDGSLGFRLLCSSMS